VEQLGHVGGHVIMPSEQFEDIIVHECQWALYRRKGGGERRE
jgi:hypothetical protein